MKNLIISFIFLSIFGCTDSNVPTKTLATTPVSENESAWFKEAPELSKKLFLKNYYVVLDGSGSMSSRGCSGNKTRTVVAKESLIAFSGALPLEDNLGLLVFDSKGVSERVALNQNNREEFIKKVKEAGADSGTPLKSAIYKAIDKIKVQAGKQLGYGEYHLVIVTDGEAGYSQDPEGAIQYIIKNTPIVVHTLGFCIGSNHSLNQEGLTLYKSADNPEELLKGLKEVLAESEEFSVDAFKE